METPLNYPYVAITNSTPYIASGTVAYESLLCSNDEYTVTPNTTWTADSRGLCLVQKISATLKTPAGSIVATPYTSSGTSYSQFAILQTGPTSFAVTRIVTGAEDQRPADHVEPTSKQK